MSAARLITPGMRLHGATYAGICTAPNGALYALLLLNDKPAGQLTWQAATDWAKGLGADLPSRPEAALLFQLLKVNFEPRLHWTNETCSWSASSAWYCNFGTGNQLTSPKSAELCARAVRRLVLDSFDALADLATATEVPV